MYVFYVPGGGLGHLSRTLKLIQLFDFKPEEVLIISPSIFRSFVNARIPFLSLSWEDTPEQWSQQLIQVLKQGNIQKCYIDAFPFGLKGELLAVYKTLPQIPFVYVARILKWQIYLKNTGGGQSILFEETLLLEYLYPAHASWIRANSKRCIFLQLPSPTTKKAEPFTKTPYSLLVHSGGAKEVQQLCEKVALTLSVNEEIRIMVLTQVKVDFKHPRFEVHRALFPVQQYFQHAEKIYTAAGFNLIQELDHFSEKHVAFAIDKLYDDQYYRLQHRFKH